MSIEPLPPRFECRTSAVRLDETIAPDAIGRSGEQLGWSGVNLYPWDDPSLCGVDMQKGGDRHLLALSASSLSVLAVSLPGKPSRCFRKPASRFIFQPALEQFVAEWRFDGPRTPCWYLQIDPELVDRTSKEWTGDDTRPARLRHDWSLDDRRLSRYFRALARELAGRGWSDQLYVDDVAVRLSLQMLRVLSADDSDRYTRRSDRLDLGDLTRSIEYLRENAARGVRLGEMASEIGLAPTELAMRFRRSTGVGMYHYQRMQRVRVAKRMLGEGAGLNEAATSVGYTDGETLHRQIRRVSASEPKKGASTA